MEGNVDVLLHRGETENETNQLVFQLSHEKTPYTGTILSEDQNSFSLHNHEKLFTAEEVFYQTGINLGELVAIIRMPHHSGVITDPERHQREENESIYCFKDPESGKHAMPAQYHLVGGEQLARITKNDDFPLEEIVTLEGPGDRQIIGREFWMPDVGYELYSKDSQDQAFKKHPTISREQLSVGVGEAGELIITNAPDVKNKNTVIKHGLRKSDNI